MEGEINLTKNMLKDKKMSTIRGCILLYRMEKDNEVRKKMNDTILRIKKSLKKTAKTYKYTRKV